MTEPCYQCGCDCHKKTPVLLYGSGKYRCMSCKCEGFTQIDPRSGFGSEPVASKIDEINSANMSEEKRNSFINDWCNSYVAKIAQAQEQACIDFLKMNGLTKEQAKDELIIYHGLNGFMSMELGLVRDQLKIDCVCGHTMGFHPTKHNLQQIEECKNLGCLECQAKAQAKADYLGSPQNKENIRCTLQTAMNKIETARDMIASDEDNIDSIDYKLESAFSDLEDLKSELEGIQTSE